MVHSGKIVIKKVGNGTQTVVVTKHKDTTAYQVGEHGDYVQEKN